MYYKPYNINISIPENALPKNYKWKALFGNAEANYIMGCLYYLGQGVEKNSSKAFSHFKKAAKKGHLVSIYNLYRCFENGIGCTKDFSKAVYYLKDGANKGDIDALYYYAQYQHDGNPDLGIKVSLESALKYFRIGATQKDPDCAYHYAIMLEKGEGCEPDISTAIKFFELAAPAVRTAANHLGMIYYEGKYVERDYTKAFELFKSAADRGSANDMISVGHLYTWGYGTQKNQNEAVKYYVSGVYHSGGKYDLFELLKEARIENISNLKRDALKMISKLADDYIVGDNTLKANPAKAVALYGLAAPFLPYAAAQYAQCLLLGKGTEKNYKKAFEVLNQVASTITDVKDQQYKEILCYLGRCHLWGCGTEQNNVKAAQYLLLAAECGQIMAMGLMGDMYWRGIGVPVDNEKAFYWTERAVKSNSNDGEVFWHLGHFYRKGIGCKTDIEKAIFYFQKAVNLNYSLAFHSLAYALRHEREGSPDYKKIFDLYKHSFNELNSAASAGELASMYIEGLGTEKNYDEAFRLAEIAANADYAEGYAILAYCYVYGLGTSRDYQLAMDNCKKVLEKYPNNDGVKKLLKKLSEDSKTLKPVSDLDEIFSDAAGQLIGGAAGAFSETFIDISFGD